MIIDKEIREFIEENFLPEKELLAEDSLLQKRIIDSTGILELVAFLEGRYGFIVEDDELVPENLDSIRKISTYVHRKIFLKKQDFCFAAEQV
jgi:acyl carrier protein